MYGYTLLEKPYHATINKSSWDIININTGEIMASFYYTLNGRDRLNAQQRAKDYIQTLNQN